MRNRKSSPREPTGSPQLAVSPSGQIAAAEVGGRLHFPTTGGTDSMYAKSGVWSLCWNGDGTALRRNQKGRHRDCRPILEMDRAQTDGRIQNRRRSTENAQARDAAEEDRSRAESEADKAAAAEPRQDAKAEPAEIKPPKQGAEHKAAEDKPETSKPARNQNE